MLFPSINFKWAFITSILLSLILYVVGGSKIIPYINSAMLIWFLVSWAVWGYSPQSSYWLFSRTVGVGPKPDGWPYFHPTNGKSSTAYGASDLVLLNQGQKISQ